MFTLITGGSKNGKSKIAEDLLQAAKGRKYYIATMEPFGEEAMEAIARHRRIRAGKGFETIEKYTDIQTLVYDSGRTAARNCQQTGDGVLEKGSSVLLECAGNLCANEMFSAHEKSAAEKILKGIEALNRLTSELVIVTNQVGEDGITYERETMEYIRQMGLLNQGMAKMANRVILAVYGIAVVLKGKD